MIDINLHIYVHSDPELVKLVAEMGDRVGKQLDDLTAQVAANTSVIESAKTLINGFAAQLAAAGTDPAALQALHDQLSTEDDALAAAVAANTPAAASTDTTGGTTADAGSTQSDTGATAGQTS
jgi:peptidoglycan hydrolase CwlO-like protein